MSVDRITILGSGTSTGVPVIGCRCAVCKSDDPLDKRYRASILLTLVGGEHIVIDTGPEFRLQMLRAGVDRLEHALYTHTHADHCHGFDDLRQFYFHRRQPVACYVATIHEADFRSRFSYAFEDTGYQGTKPQVELVTYDEAPFEIAGVTVEPALVPHGPFRTAAFKIGRFCYATDFKAFPAELEQRWAGTIDVMVASGVHFGAHPAHSTVPETVGLFKRLGVREGYVTHLGHEVDAKRDAGRLPSGIQFARDGLEITADLTSDQPSRGKAK